ncbi:signal peptidase II [Methylocystis sp. MJC1]|uniref:signal peptidase II n=1 Tax=Methylocystis sp. MJC1 TaxID=2654282 RepID=UPI0013ECF32C|nr:signal peptidase II [Methylocystis sp. MJC1]KAF2989664.1 Lipoprotein signal peptidase [Methylocystis sp. MJC1]MBU6525628.1 signal peptidase II [Methylocystis sp. MJC1]UZX12102.1 signal peptidase II [Methylocystis sp. MJC1]
MPPFLTPPRVLGLAAALAAALADQAHKYWMLDIFGIQARQPITLAPFLDVVLSWNYGVSYSLFQTHEGVGRALLLAGQSVIVAGLLWWLWRSQSRLTTLAVGLVVGGALGNAVDRLTRGAVADFFYFHTTLPVGPLANYVFNVADVAISAGVALLLFENIFAPAPSAQDATDLRGRH